MAPWKRNTDGRLEEKADSFLKAVPSPPTPRRLEEYGLQRVYARAQAGERVRARIAERRGYRHPALLRRAVLVTLAVLALMVVGTGGAYALSYGAQPDSALYGTKIFFERARVALNPSASGDARLEMGFCDRRMNELERMYQKGSGEGAERWLREYLRNMDGARSSIESLRQEETETLYLAYLDALQRQAGAMERMRGGGSPARLEGSIEEAYRACEMERERVRMRCGQDGAGQHGGGCENGMDGEGGAGNEGSGNEGGPEQEAPRPGGSGTGEGEGSQQVPQPEGTSLQPGGNGAVDTGDISGGSTRSSQSGSTATQYGTMASGEQVPGTDGGGEAGGCALTGAQQRRLCP